VLPRDAFRLDNIHAGGPEFESELRHVYAVQLPTQAAFQKSRCDTPQIDTTGVVGLDMTALCFENLIEDVTDYCKILNQSD
jgi:hypothetical protein